MSGSKPGESAPYKAAFIRRVAGAELTDPTGLRIYWTEHARQRIFQMEVDIPVVDAALAHCDLVEDYPTLARPLPDCLVLVWLAEDEPLHVVVAVDVDNDTIRVVTVYRPDRGKWEDDYKTRRA